jgi:TatD DNase family protein
MPVSPEEAIAEARAGGVERIVTIGVGRQSSERAVALAERHPEVSATVGVHPHDAEHFRAADLDWMRALATRPEVVAVGECGLDYHYDNSPRDAQAEAFAAQIALARETGLPLVIHTRDAARDTLDLLARDAGDHPVLLHCFSLVDELDEVIERDYWMSFAGTVTFTRSDDLRAAAARAPEDRLLVETDSPYLTPVPHRGTPNRPAHVVHTLAAVAAARGIPAEDLDAITSTNAARLFGW